MLLRPFGASPNFARLGIEIVWSTVEDTRPHLAFIELGKSSQSARSRSNGEEAKRVIVML